MTRRDLVTTALTCALRLNGSEERSLLDGTSLKGWHAVPRLPVAVYPGASKPSPDSPAYRRAMTSKGRWTVEHAAIVGGQEPPGSGMGAYLLTDKTFADFELSLECNPDWGVDTGVMVRATSLGSQGFQIHVDHRTMGSMGTFYGNGTGAFRARQFAFQPRRDSRGDIVGLEPTDVPETESAKLAWAAPPDAFFKAWRFKDWNTLQIHVTGRLPRITTWINGVKIARLDAASLRAPNYDAEAVAALLGERGHIALEVHNSGGTDRIGAERWLPGAVCRWRNIRLREW